MPHPTNLSIAFAAESEVGLIFDFISQLAEYEKLSQEVSATEASLREALFGARPYAECLIARLDGAPAGFALFFHNFSTFKGKPGIYLEDLFVNPALRGNGVGKALLSRLGEIARDRGCGRLEWSVLDWNTPAMEFYKRLGARPMEDWTVFRMTEDVIGRLADLGSG
jgi:GNAT superfamily N-acetyltransferase